MTAPTSSAADAASPDASPARIGWFADPWRRHQVRFFDGEQWTEHVADGGLAGLDSTPVAHLPRSHPHPPTEAPPDGAGPRVLDGVGSDPQATDPVDLPLLLLDLGGGDDGAHRLTDPEDVAVGSIVDRPASLVSRLGRLLVSEPSTRVTALSVRDAAAGEVLRVTRPATRTDPTVDVRKGSTLLGRIRAEAVVQGLRAVVEAADGTVVGRLVESSTATASLTVTDPTGMILARTTSVWDVPGVRHHLPPGVVLVDRRAVAAPDPGAPGTPPSGPPARPELAGLLLGTLLAPVLLRPPT